MDIAEAPVKMPSAATAPVSISIFVKTQMTRSPMLSRMTRVSSMESPYFWGAGRCRFFALEACPAVAFLPSRPQSASPNHLQPHPYKPNARRYLPALNIRIQQTDPEESAALRSERLRLRKKRVGLSRGDQA